MDNFLSNLLGQDIVLFGDDYSEIKKAKNTFSKTFRIYSKEQDQYVLLKIFNKQEILKQTDQDFLLSQINF